MSENNKQLEQIICNFMADYIDSHFDEITCDLTKSEMPKEKAKVIEIVKTDFETAMWFLTEVATWGMKVRNALSHIHLENNSDEWSTININGTLIDYTFTKEFTYSIRPSIFVKDKNQKTKPDDSPVVAETLKQQVATILKADLRSVDGIMTRPELVQRILTEKPVSVSEFAEKGILNVNQIKRLISFQRISSFNNLPGAHGSKFYIFESELMDYLIDGNYLEAVNLTHFKNIIGYIVGIVDELGISRKKFRFLSQYVQGKTIKEIAKQEDVTAESVRLRVQSASKELFARLNKMQFLNKEIDVLEQKKNDLQNEINFINNLIKEKIKTVDRGTVDLTVLQKPISDCDFSERNLNLMKHTLGIKTLGELVTYSESDYLKFRNAGVTSLKNVKEVLEQHGLKLSNTNKQY